MNNDRDLATPAKITPPSSQHCMLRPRLFEKLAAIGKDCQVAWISAPAGSGKTSLATSFISNLQHPYIWYQFDAMDEDVGTFFHYLSIAWHKAGYRFSLPIFSTEHLNNLPAFGRQYFRRMLQRVTPGTWLVFDDHHELPETSPLQHALLTLADEISQECSLLILSRNMPPPSMARLQLYGRLGRMDESDLQFSMAECRHLATDICGNGEPDIIAEQAHRLSKGWAAGLQLLLSHHHQARDTTEIICPDDEELLFQYFAEELFNHLDRHLQQILLKTCFLSPILVNAATQIVETTDCQELFAFLHKHNHFTTKVAGHAGLYQFHPLFRAFLQHTARQRFSPAELQSIISKTATVLEETGNIEHAAALYMEAGSWDQLACLIRHEADRFLREGRNNTVLRWLRALPLSVIQTEPWLNFWGGQAALGTDPERSRAYFIDAFDLFAAAQETTDALLAWSGIIDSYVYAWSDFRDVDPWLEKFDTLMENNPNLPPATDARVTLGIFKILAWRKPNFTDIHTWKQRLRKLVFQSDDKPFRLIAGGDLLHYESFMGDFRAAALLVDKLRADGTNDSLTPITRLYWLCMQSIYEFLAGEHDQCLQTVQQAADLQERCGLFLFDLRINTQGLASALCHGDKKALARYKPKVFQAETRSIMEKSLQRYLVSLYYLHTGDFLPARSAAETAWELAESSGSPFSYAIISLALAQSEFGLGNEAKAQKWLSIGKTFAEGIENIACQAELMEAWFALEKGDQTAADKALRQGFERAASHHYGNFPIWDHVRMQQLCARALAQGIEADYVRKLIRHRNLSPPKDSDTSTIWPWPVRIHALGNFRIESADPDPPPTKKQEKRPLELLKILLAAGPDGLLLEQIIEDLCPDKASKSAYNIYSVTLHRLRQRLGQDRLLVTGEGRLFLDQRYCWVDAWEFARLCDQAHHRPKVSGDDPALDLDRAISLYKGNFLGGQTDSTSQLIYGEELKRLYIQATFSRARLEEKKEAWKRAVRIYQKGMEILPCHEPFYRAIMFCYGQIGYSDGVRQTYEQCRTALERHLELAPSSETENLYRKLRD